MPPTYRIVITPFVAEQLQEIYDYIQQDSPQNAPRMIARLLDSIDRLEIFPHRYKVVRNTEEAGGDVHSMPVRPYLVRYEINDVEGVVTIMSVRHGARKSS